jgi:hypothetical protein
MAGYADAGPVGEPFLRIWSAILLGGMLATMARFPDRRGARVDDLRALAAEL